MNYFITEPINVPTGMGKSTVINECNTNLNAELACSLQGTYIQVVSRVQEPRRTPTMRVILIDEVSELSPFISEPAHQL